MAYAVDSRRVGAAFVAVVSTALLVWFGTGLNPLWPLFWFAPLPVLIFALRSSWWAAFLTAFLAFVLGNLNLWHYFKHVLGAPVAVRITILALPALVVALAVLLFRALLKRGAWWSALLAFPSTWVAFEYLLNLTSPHGTAMSLSYSQLNCLPVLQLASITGPWGISFLLLSFPAALAIGFHLRHAAPKQALRVVSATLLACALVLIYGTVRLAQPSPGPTVRVGLVASDLPANQGVAARVQTERLLRDYAARLKCSLRAAHRSSCCPSISARSRIPTPFQPTLSFSPWPTSRGQQLSSASATPLCR